MTANFGLDFGYSTSLYSANTDTTNIYTQSTTNWPGPDNWKVIVNKINNNFRILRGWILPLQSSVSSLLSLTNTVAGPSLSLSSYTVTSSTNSTAGIPFGTVFADTNYLYEAVTTNQWRRIAWPTNGW